MNKWSCLAVTINYFDEQNQKELAGGRSNTNYNIKKKLGTGVNLYKLTSYQQVNWPSTPLSSNTFLSTSVLPTHDCISVCTSRTQHPYFSPKPVCLHANKSSERLNFLLIQKSIYRDLLTTITMIVIIVMQVGIILLKRLKKIFMKMFALSKIFRGLRWKLEWTIAYKTKGRDPLNPF